MTPLITSSSIFFGGIPVYHPLEIVPALPNDDPRDFVCGPENLLIGGGSGEHPGIVVKTPGDTVACFVRAWLRGQQHLVQDQDLRPATEAWPDVSDRRETRGDCRQVFDFAGWKAEDYVQFSTRCRSRAFHRPFDPGEDEFLEQWLAASVGEFILFAMPELADDVIQRLGDLRSHVSGDIYRNILLLPPGYPVWGRREVDNQVIWGISAWQIYRE